MTLDELISTLTAMRDSTPDAGKMRVFVTAIAANIPNWLHASNIRFVPTETGMEIRLDGQIGA